MVLQVADRREPRFFVFRLDDGKITVQYSKVSRVVLQVAGRGEPRFCVFRLGDGKIPRVQSLQMAMTLTLSLIRKQALLI